MPDDRGTLALAEPHPAARSALHYLNSLGLDKLMAYMNAYSSCAIESNRLGEVCAETLRRLMDGEMVSDRYLLGLAWSIRGMEERGDA